MGKREGSLVGCVEGAEEGTVEGCELGPVEGACVTGDLKHDLLNDFNIYCYHVRTCAFTLKPPEARHS